LGKSLTLNDNEAVVAAACAGLGIVQVPTYSAAEDLSIGKLQVILADYTKERGDISLVWQPSRPEVPRIRAFADFVVRTLRDYAH
jgi:DNA-binding transcriptional LysR family regulator